MTFWEDYGVKEKKMLSSGHLANVCVILNVYEESKRSHS